MTEKNDLDAIRALFVYGDDDASIVARVNAAHALIAEIRALREVAAAADDLAICGEHTLKIPSFLKDRCRMCTEGRDSSCVPCSRR